MKVPETARCSIPGTDDSGDGGHDCMVDSSGYGSCGYFAILPEGSLCPYMLEVYEWQDIQPLFIKKNVEAKRIL